MTKNFFFNTQKHLGSFAILLMLIAGCQKKLELTNPNFPSVDNFFSNEKEARIGLNGVYDAWQVDELAAKRYNEIDHLSDNATTVNNQGWTDIESSDWMPVNPRVTGRWTAYYTVVNRANYVIKKISEMAPGSISEESQARIIAEALFLRDYAYFDMVQLWGDLPFYTQPNSSFDVGKQRTPKAEIYVFLVSELQTKVIPNLPLTVSGSDKAHITSDAAKALLGKFYLFQQDWQNAATVFKEIIDDGRYKLHPNYADLFTLNGEFSKENLWEIEFVTGGIDNGEVFSIQIDTTLAPTKPRQYWKPVDNFANSFLCTDGKPIANSPLYGSKSPLYAGSSFQGKFGNRDPRLRATILTGIEVTPGGKKIWNFNNGVNAANNYAIGKYRTLTNVQYIGGPQNYYMIRYADVLLMYAEAMNEFSGPDPSVYDAVNLVRRRVNMPDYPAGLSQQNMRQYIRDERRWELGLEHSRYFDLLRWHIADSVLNAVGGIKKFTDPRDYQWPYPQLEMDNNANMRKDGQNSGW